MDYFASLTANHLASMIRLATKSVYLCMPSVHSDIANAIKALGASSDSRENSVSISVLLDYDAKTFRQGYGSYSDVNDLLSKKFQVRRLKDNRISFLIVDDMGYYLFIESRSLIPADKQTINAVTIDPVSIVRLKQYFFPDNMHTDYSDELANAVIEESKLLAHPEQILHKKPAPIVDISDEEIKAVTSDLTRNPPLNPDYKRLVEVYSNNFQYVKLKFEGANVLNTKIKVPSKALPLMGGDLKKRLETKLNVFSDQDFKALNPLNQIKESIEVLRAEYLTNIKSREDSVIRVDMKKRFEKEVKDLNDKLLEVRAKMLSSMAKQIKHTMDELVSELINFFVNNPKALSTREISLFAENDEYIKSQAEKKALQVINSLAWPEPHTLVSAWTISYYYSDITYEDLRNAKLLEELKEKGLLQDADMSQLAVFQDAIPLQQKVK